MVVRFCGTVGIAVAALVVCLYGLVRGGWLDALIAGIAIGMSLLPEEFPVVLAIFMAMGAWRIAQVGVLTRRASAIESMHGATVFCTDKTENRRAAGRARGCQDVVMLVVGGSCIKIKHESSTRYGTK